MPVNDMSFNQISTVLAEITQQATGTKVIAPIDTGSFVSVGQMALKTGFDPVMNAISQVLSKTIFSIRPYHAKFKGMQVSDIRYGNHVRKLQVADKPFEDDERIPLSEGDYVSMYTINKPNVLQTNFYGQNVYQKSMTIFRDQLDTALTGPDQFQLFLSMVLTNANDMLEQARENIARGALANFIGGKSVSNAESVVNLLTLYNAQTGGSFTPTTIYDPENYTSFMKWAYAKIAFYCSKMTERSKLFHTNITGKEISRHTPYRDMNVYLHAAVRYDVEARVLADTFHDNYLRYADVETVNYWQNIEEGSEQKVENTPMVLNEDGTITKAAPVELSGVFAAVIDREAVGYNLTNQWSAPTPFNPAGGYTNIFWHETARYWNDFTENGIVFIVA